MISAEWTCTKCGTDNRMYIKQGVTPQHDKCITCKQRHTITPGQRPVRWEAVPTK